MLLYGMPADSLSLLIINLCGSATREYCQNLNQRFSSHSITVPSTQYYFKICGQQVAIMRSISTLIITFITLLTI